MELISTHFIKTQDIGYHGNLFGGVMLAWLDEAAAAFAAQVADTPSSEFTSTAKEIKKESGKQKLKDLGLDDDEIKALTGA